MPSFTQSSAETDSWLRCPPPRHLAHNEQQGDPSRVTVVMTTRKRREQTLASLAHLCSLPDRPPVVVVDNGSTDGTAAAIRARCPQVRVVEAQRNLGAPARTIGVHHAATPYIAFSDDDSWWGRGSRESPGQLLFPGSFRRVSNVLCPLGHGGISLPSVTCTFSSHDAQ